MTDGYEDEESTVSSPRQTVCLRFDGTFDGTFFRRVHRILIPQRLAKVIRSPPGQSLGNVHVEGVLDLIRINALAPLKLVEALIYNISLSERKLVALQSSQMGSITNNHSGDYYEYRLSKVALNMIARNLAHDLKPRHVTVVALHPGWVQTRMGGQSAPVTVEASVAGQQALFARLTMAHSGRFYNYDGTELPW